MTNEYDILGQQVVAEVMGEGGKLDAQFGINAVAELASRVANTVESKKADEQAKKDADAKLRAVTNADVAWANAEAALAVAQPDQKAAAQVLVQSAQTAALAAGMGLSAELQQKRLLQAQKAAADAAQASLKDPSHKVKAATMAAWQKIVAAIAQQALSQPASTALTTTTPTPGQNFFTRQYGGVPVWGWAVGGTALVGGIYLVVRALKRR